MPPVSAPIAALRFDGRALHVLDQTRLPAEEVWLELTDAASVAAAIHRLAVRGAPNLGIAGAYGVAVAVAAGEDLDAAAALLRDARPTAVNLAWGVDRAAAAARGGDGPEAAAEEAAAIEAEEAAASAAIARAGADWLAARGVRRVLTHCNTGALACGGEGSALAVALELHRRDPSGIEVLAAETRPLLQGARLTVWELARRGVPHALCADGAAAGLVLGGHVDAVVVGCDRVARNGDVANKVGTLAHALAAQDAGIPFVVAGPVSSIDLDLASGDDIPIEERDAEEVRTAGGVLLTLPDTPVRNPAFDVTPARLVSALVTERGVLRPSEVAAL